MTVETIKTEDESHYERFHYVGFLVPPVWLGMHSDTPKKALIFLGITLALCLLVLSVAAAWIGQFPVPTFGYASLRDTGLELAEVRNRSNFAWWAVLTLVCSHVLSFFIGLCNRSENPVHAVRYGCFAMLFLIPPIIAVDRIASGMEAQVAHSMAINYMYSDIQRSLKATTDDFEQPTDTRMVLFAVTQALSRGIGVKEGLYDISKAGYAEFLVHRAVGQAEAPMQDAVD